MKPYYDEDGITIYHGDALDIIPDLPRRNHRELFIMSPRGLDLVRRAEEAEARCAELERSHGQELELALIRVEKAEGDRDRAEQEVVRLRGEMGELLVRIADLAEGLARQFPEVRGLVEAVRS